MVFFNANPQPNWPARYTKIEELGRGGFGVVYRVMDTLTRNELALKMLRTPCTQDAAKRFQREVEETRGLSSDRIVKILGYDLTANPPYYTMPYYRGGSLQGVIDLARNEQKYFLAQNALIILASVAEGMKVAHAKGVFHRDLKPQNLLLNKEGDIVVSDFGVGKFANRFSFDLTQGRGLGTTGYCSPEQARTGEGSVTSDVYSMGVILRALLDPSGVGQKHPGRVIQLLNQMTASDPARRPQSCEALLEEIDAILKEVFNMERPKKIPWGAIAAGVGLGLLALLLL